MLDIEQLRSRQEQRRARSLELWNQAKQNVENAIALAETREREFHEVSEDVRRMMDALDLVVGMANQAGTGDKVPTAQNLDAAERQHMRKAEPEANDGSEDMSGTQSATSSLHRLGGLLNKTSLPLLLKRSSRPFFSGRQRSEFSSLSILR